MKSKGKRSEPKAGRRDPASSDVADDDAYSSNPIHLAQQRRRFGSSEVMQNLRAHHDVDAVVGKRQVARVGTNREIHRTPAGLRELGGGIESDCRELYAVAARLLSRSARNVAESGAYIEQRGVAWHLLQRVLQFVERGADSAEPRVRARHIGERSRDEFGIDVRRVENLVAPFSRWRQKVSQRVSAPAVRNHRGNRGAGSRVPRASLPPRQG